MTVSKLVENLTVLAPGDHIKWKSVPGYDHHAIVECVDYQTREVHVIEYTGNIGDFVIEYTGNIRDRKRSGFGKAQVKRNKTSDIRNMYKYVYDTCLDAWQVLKRAKDRLGERDYNPFTNNCEHFATWCKTGKKYCSQVRSFVDRVGVIGATGGSGGIATATGRCVARSAADAALNGTTITTELKSLLSCGGPKQVVKNVWGVVANGGKEIGKTCINKLSSFAVTGTLSVVTEAIFFGYNCYKAQKKYRDAIKHAENDHERENFKKQRNQNIKHSACESAGGVLGSAVGAVALSWIPVVGTAIGALGGNLVGRLFGRMFGRWLFK